MCTSCFAEQGYFYFANYGSWWLSGGYNDSLCIPPYFIRCHPSFIPYQTPVLLCPWGWISFGLSAVMNTMWLWIYHAVCWHPLHLHRLPCPQPHPRWAHIKGYLEYTFAWVLVLNKQVPTGSPGKWDSFLSTLFLIQILLGDLFM